MVSAAPEAAEPAPEESRTFSGTRAAIALARGNDGPHGQRLPLAHSSTTCYYCLTEDEAQVQPWCQGGRVVHHALARLLIVAAIVFTALPTPASAECEICFKFFDDEWCYPAKSGESGVTSCTNPEEASCCCNMGGQPCTGGAGGSGGGGGGWGGGGGACSGSGFCPAECFSCGGGGSV